MYETEKIRPGTELNNRPTSVDFPDPDGAEMIKTVVLLIALLKVKSLFANFIDLGFGCQGQIRHGQADVAQPSGF